MIYSDIFWQKTYHNVIFIFETIFYINPLPQYSAIDLV